MHTGTGEIGILRDMEKKYGRDNPSIVPIPEKKISPMSKWGRKKRERYAELLREGLSQGEAFSVVEYNKGELQEQGGE
jgi:hypothetical protein